MLDNMDTLDMMTISSADYKRLVEIAIAAEAFLRLETSEALSDLNEAIRGGQSIID